MVTRKNFIHLASMSIGSLVVPNILLSNTSPGISKDSSPMKDLARQALDAATAGGASYADVRICTRPTLSISTRVLVNGAWGFASIAALSADAAKECVKQAIAGAAENEKPPVKARRHQYNLKDPHEVWVCEVLRK
jgi:TldD protein